MERERTNDVAISLSCGTLMHNCTQKSIFCRVLKGEKGEFTKDLIREERSTIGYRF